MRVRSGYIFLPIVCTIAAPTMMMILKCIAVTVFVDRMRVRKRCYSHLETNDFWTFVGLYWFENSSTIEYFFNHWQSRTPYRLNFRCSSQCSRKQKIRSEFLIFVSGASHNFYWCKKKKIPSEIICGNATAVCVVHCACAHAIWLNARSIDRTPPATADISFTHQTSNATNRLIISIKFQCAASAVVHRCMIVVVSRTRPEIIYVQTVSAYISSRAAI